MTNDKKHLSVPIKVPSLLKLNIWCKVEEMTQEEAIDQLITKHAPEYGLNIKEV